MSITLSIFNCQNVEEAFQGFGEDQLLDILESKLSRFSNSSGWKVRLVLIHSMLRDMLTFVGPLKMTASMGIVVDFWFYFCIIRQSRMPCWL